MPGIKITTCLLFLVLSTAGFSQSSSFEKGTEGWSSALLAEPVNNPPENVAQAYPILPSNDGNPGNSIYSWDPGIHAWYFSAPASFLGDQSSFFGGEIRWDMRVFFEATTSSRSLILVGGGQALFGPFEFESSPNVPIANWRSFAVELTGSSFDRVWSDPESDATDEELQTVLGDLTAIYILGGWGMFGGGVTRMDDVIMRNTPLLLGDANFDGEVNFLDVEPWIDCVTNAEYVLECDIDQNGVIDFHDIMPFVEILGGH